MGTSRLELALEGGLDLPGTGDLAVIGPRAGADLSALPKDRVVVVTGFAPDHAAFEARGFRVAVVPEGRYAAVIVCLPRAKEAARARIAEAVALSDGPVIVDGQRLDGIESILRACRKRAEVTGPVNKAHGKLFWFQGGEFTDWAEAPPRQVEDGHVTAPGVFSADGVDPGSALLAAALPASLSGRIADLGAGWGYLAAEILTRPGVTRVDLVEAEHAALDCARRNVSDTRARFHWADATTWTPDAAPDAVVMNPPFHRGRDADPGIGRGFIQRAATILRPGGRLWLVANRHLPYEADLAAGFSEVGEVAGDARFKVLTGTKRARQRRTDRQG